jgi:hypothetical protein
MSKYEHVMADTLEEVNISSTNRVLAKVKVPNIYKGDRTKLEECLL